MNIEKISIESLMTVIKEIMWNTEFAMRSYVKLRPRFVHLSAGIANHSGSSCAQTDFSQLLNTAPSFHCCRLQGGLLVFCNTQLPGLRITLENAANGF
jgi:nucleoporin p58/p45